MSQKFMSATVQQPDHALEPGAWGTMQGEGSGGKGGDPGGGGSPDVVKLPDFQDAAFISLCLRIQPLLLPYRHRAEPPGCWETPNQPSTGSGHLAETRWLSGTDKAQG